MNKITILTVMVILITLTFLAKGYSQELHCDQTIYEDTTLESDLVCDGTALRIGAGNITLDLNGHALIGNGTDTGIINAPAPHTGYDYVVIKNGVISNFDTGIYQQFALESTIKDLIIQKHGDHGIKLRECVSATIKDCVIQGKIKCSDDGIALESDKMSIVSENIITKNEIGIIILGSSEGTQINENVLKNNTSLDIYVPDSISAITHRENECTESDPEIICEN